MSLNRFKGNARTIVGLVVFSLCLGAANCRANVEDAPRQGATGTLLLEAEDFQGVVSRDIWSSNNTWTRAVGAGVDGLADVASGGDMIYAGGSRLVVPDLEIADAPRILVAKAISPDGLTWIWHDANVRGWRAVKPLRVEAGFQMVDMEIDCFRRGPGMSVFYCGDLAPPLNIWWNAVVDRYDPEGNLAFIRTNPPYPSDAYGLTTMGGAVCFGWNEKDATKARAKPEASTYYWGVQR